MFNSENLILELVNSNSNILIGKNTDLTFSIKNIDASLDLYNLTLEFIMPDGLVINNGSLNITNISDNIYSFINIKDLAANELDFKFSVEIGLNESYSDGSDINIGDIFSFKVKAYADDMPRGSFDANNEVIVKEIDINTEALSYLIKEGALKDLLLGEISYFEFSIETSTKTELNLEELNLILANGIEFTYNIQFIGYTSVELENYMVISPSESNNNYEINWSNINIPLNTKVIIKYEVLANERYYKTGAQVGDSIKHGDEEVIEIKYKILGINFSLSYSVKFLEFIINLILSKTNIDIADSIDYKVRIRSNAYSQLSNIILYLVTSDGQVLNDNSTPSFISKTVSQTGITQVVFNIQNIGMLSEVDIDIGGLIGINYSNGLKVYAGDSFTVSAEVQVSSSISADILNANVSKEMRIGVPTVKKVITGIYYRDLELKTINTVAAGDYIGYKITYDSLNIKAPAKRVKIFDFYPLSSRDISNIEYSYSNPQYPNTDIVTVNPNGVFWFVQEIEGSISFDIDFKVQTKYDNLNNYFNNNLAKLQVLNSEGINYSTRDEAIFNIGKPNIKTVKTITGNNINKIKIDEVYLIKVEIINNKENLEITDGFNINFTEEIDSGLNLDAESVNIVSNKNIVPTITGNIISFNIEKISALEKITLTYLVRVEDGLNPKETFNLKSSISSPYAQKYDITKENLIYDILIYQDVKKLKSEDIMLILTKDKSIYIVGDNAEYSLEITIPMGQKISSLYGLILIPDTNTFTGEGYLNGEVINPEIVNNTVIFESIINIDTTSEELILNYKIKSEIVNSIVSNTTPNQTIENLYGNVNYVDRNNLSVNKGISNNITVKHPVVTLALGSSNINSNFSQLYNAKENIVFTEVRVVNSSEVNAENIKLEVNIPEHLEFLGEDIKSGGATYIYDEINRKIIVSFTDVLKGSEKYFVFKGSIVSDVYSESTLLLTGIIKEYYNDVSLTKVYSSQVIRNSTVYIKSIFLFEPLSFYKLLGSSSALNLSLKGEETKISYIVTNNGQGIENLKLNITEISYPYSIYVGSDFIQYVNENTDVSISTDYLKDIKQGSSRYINIVYSIPLGEEVLYYDTMLVKLTSENNINSFKIVPTTLQDP